MVLIGCISRSRGQKIGFQYAIFKNLLVRNYKAQSFHIWYIASSRGPLPKLFKLCPWGQNLPRPGGHNFTLNYKRKISNDIFSGTTNGNLTKLHRNDPWVVPYQSCLNRSSWLHKEVTGSKNRFSKCNFQKSSTTKVVQIMALGTKFTPPRGSQFYIELYKEKFKQHLLLNR